MMNYEKQADDFLIETGTTMEVVESIPQKKPLWCKEEEKHGIQYGVTLKNERYSYTFDFWGSIADREMLEIAEEQEKRGANSQSPLFFKLKDFLKNKGIKVYTLALGGYRFTEKTKEAIKPKAYDVLACLDTLSIDTFEDFCSDFGYDTDSIIAERTYRAVQEQDRELRKLFTPRQLEKLQKIM